MRMSPPRQVSVHAIVTALITSSLATSLTLLDSTDVYSLRAMNVSYYSSHHSSTTQTDDGDAASEPVVTRTQAFVIPAQRATSSPNVGEERSDNASTNFTELVASPCRPKLVDDDRTVMRPSFDENCSPVGMSSLWNRHGAKSAAAGARADADPVSVILKSFFQIQNAAWTPSLPASEQSKQTKSSRVDKQQISYHGEDPAKDRHAFLWSVEDTAGTGSDYQDDVLVGSDRRRSTAVEDFTVDPANNCARNHRLTEGAILPHDCSVMRLTDIDNSSTVNVSQENGDDDGEFSSVAAGEMASFLAVGVVLSAICLATVVGNALVLVAIVSNGHLRGTTHYFIANLAVADLLLGVSVLPFSAALETIDRWVFGETFCDVWAAMDVLCCTASILSLCVISVDRYVGVTRPLQHSTIMTERRAGWVIVAVWLLSFAISVAPLFGWKEPREPDSDPGICDVTKQTGYVLFSVAGSFYIPLSVVLVVYYRVYREAVRQSRFLSTGVKTTDFDYSGSTSEVTLRVHTGRLAPGSTGGSRKGSIAVVQDSGHQRPTHLRVTVAGKVAKFKREKKAAKTLGIVVGVFVLCWFPFFFVLPLGKNSVVCFTR